jgi:NitT/TauT family transport system substrate-binding protein
VLRGLATCLLFALALGARPALADDTLTIIGAAPPAGFYEVLDYVANGAGFFSEQHLVVQKQYIPNSATAAQLVASGKADIVGMSIEPIYRGYDKGLRLQCFFARDPQYDFVIGVLADSPIRTLADFKGRDIGEMSANSGAEVAANSMLAGAGLNRSDYSYVVIGGGAGALGALTSKKVAGVAFPSTEINLESIAGNAKFRIYRHPILNDFGTYCYAAQPATIQAKADQLRRYTRAMVEASLLTRENPRVAARYFLQGAGIKVTPEAIAAEVRALKVSQGALPAADPWNKAIGYTSLPRMKLYGQFLIDSGQIAKPVPAAAIATNEFIAYANDFDRKAFIGRVRQLP